jgi:mycothiol synthase
MMTAATPLPPGYRWRAPTLDDAAEAVAMENGEAVALVGVPLVSEEWQRSQWTAPGFVLEENAALVIAADERIAGTLLVESAPPHRAVFQIGVVAKEHHGRGLGGALVDEGERRARAMVELAAPGDRVVMHAGTLADEPMVSSLLAGRGYVEVRRFSRMAISFDDAPAAPPAPPGIVLRPAREGEQSDVYRCLQTAFEDHWGENRLDEEAWLHARAGDESVWLVAVDGNQIVAALVASLRSEEDPDYGYVDQLGVLRSHRRRGVARALLLGSFCEFHRRGKRGVHLHVDTRSPTGATHLYEAAGMRPAPRFATWEKELRPASPAQ